MKNKTIITELFEDIEKFGWKVVQNKINFYLKKEKQQILDSHYDAAIRIVEIKFPEKIEKCTNDFQDAEQYYKETYGEEESN